MSQRGQVLIEHSIMLIVVILPLSAGILRWGSLEFERTRCAYAAFSEARRRLISENRVVEAKITCNSGITESVRLTPLREIKAQDPLTSIEGWVVRASSLLEELSHFSSSSSGQGSD